MSWDRRWYAELVRSCEDLSQGKRLESLLLTTAPNTDDLFLRNLLLSMYARCGSFQDAQRTFDSIPQPNVYSWNLLIHAYQTSGHLENTRRSFHAMDPTLRSIVTWNLLLSAYSHHGTLQDAQLLFRHMPQRDVISWTTLLTAFAHSGQVHHTESLFHSMPFKTPVSWNAMLTAYLENDRTLQAYSLFQTMPEKNILSWSAMILALARNGDLVQARRLFDQVPQRTLALWNGIVSAFAGTDGLERDARELFEAMPERDAGAFSAMVGACGRVGDIAGARRMLLDVPGGCGSLSTCTALIVEYARNGYLSEARSLFDWMTVKDVVVWNAMICACAENAQMHLAKDLFDEAPEYTVTTWNTMVTAYGKSGDLDSAKEIFENVPERNVISWNAMLAAYAMNGEKTLAMWLFCIMDQEGVFPSCVSFISVLESVGDLRQGRLLHEECRRCSPRGSNHDQVVLANSFINLYMRHGCMEDARLVFHTMPEHSVSTWSSMVSGYARNGEISLAEEIYELLPPSFPVEALDSLGDGKFTACSEVSDVCGGRRLEGAVYRSAVHNNTIVGNGLISLYGRCGSLRDARRVFERVAERDLITWNAMLAAEAQSGSGGKTLEVLRLMRVQGVDPDSVTRAIVLFSCSHVGEMVEIEGVGTGVGCSAGGVVDLLGRAGMLEAAEKVVRENFETDGDAWRALLAACRMHGDVKRGLLAVRTLMALQPRHSSAYALAANVCAN